MTIACEYPCILDAPKVIPTGQSSTVPTFLLDVVVINHEAGLAFHGAAHIVVAFDSLSCWLCSCCLGDLLDSGGYQPLNVLARLTTAGGTSVTSLGHVDGTIVQEWHVTLIMTVIIIVLNPAPAVRTEGFPPPCGLWRIPCSVVADATSTTALSHHRSQIGSIVP